MRAIDTNVLIRLLVRDDTRQAQAADKFIEGGAWVSILALAETAWVLSSVYERSRLELATAMGKLLDHETLSLQDSDLVLAALHLFRSNRGVEFSDCLMLELAKKAGHQPLGTFDRKLGKITGAEIVA